jgi:hypothetical protein
MSLKPNGPNTRARAVLSLNQGNVLYLKETSSVAISSIAKLFDRKIIILAEKQRGNHCVRVTTH